MARIYVIAGAPGVGKSSAAHQFVPTGLDILDVDFFAQINKNYGNADYNFLLMQNTIAYYRTCQL